MILEINKICLNFYTKRNNIIEAILSKFSHFCITSSDSIYECKIIEKNTVDVEEVLQKYNLHVLADKYNYTLNSDKTILFESFDNSFVLTDLINDVIFFHIDQSKRLLEHTIIVKLLYHIYFYLTKYNLFNIHCSCFTINQDLNNCVAIIGNKHSGKTTLSLRMYSNGEFILCDDSLLFDASSSKAIPNITPAKAYLEDINILNLKNINIVKQLEFDDNKYQIRCLQSLDNPYVRITPSQIIILDDLKKEKPYFKRINKSCFIVEALSRTLISEYCQNPKYLQLLNKLSESSCYFLTPSTDSLKTFQFLKSILY